MDTPPVSLPTVSAVQTVATAPKDGEKDGSLTFHEILSALNPLQYLPVIGTIYRAVTGDTIPEGLRIAGSFVFSGLTGGPLGMILNAAATLAEKITGIDPEAIGRDIADSLGLGSSKPAPASTVAAAAPPAAAATVEAGAAEPAFTFAQLAAYGAEPPPGDPASGLPAPAPVSPSRHRAGLALYARSAIA